MLISASTWNLRLSHEFEAMQAFPVCDLFSWKIEPRQKPPAVKAYRVTYNVKTMIRSPDGTVIRLGKVLAFSPDCTNPNSAANPAAAADWNQKMRTSKPYPCGRVDFPHPVGY